MIQHQMEAARRGRWAMTAMFFANGFVMGGWAPQIPLLMTRLSITETTLGILILLFGLGALVAMPLCGYLMGRYGSRALLRTFSVLTCFGLLAVVTSWHLWIVAPAMIFFGAAIGGMDVAMNTNAVVVEKRLGRAIMSASHGFWSLGGFVGGALGGIAIQTFGYMAHALFVTVAVIAIVAITFNVLIDDERHASAGTEAATAFSWPRQSTVYLIGIIALFCMIPEGAVLDWAALYLRQELGADIATAGFAFAAFSATMAVMRFLGDRVRHRFGAVATLRVSSLVAATGLLVAGFADNAWLAIAAFAVTGFGVANIVPIAFSAAGNQAGVSAGTGMSIVTTMGYSGILVAPSAVGFIGERTGFGVVFIALAGLLAVVFMMAGLTRSADFSNNR